MSNNSGNQSPYAQKEMTRFLSINDDDDAAGDEHAFVEDGDDPLILQLPRELRKYVKRPEEHSGKLVFVERSPSGQCIHQTLSVLCCCWSICRCHLVKEGQIALTQYGDEPQILGPGRHALLSPLNEFISLRDFRDTVIKHGPLHIIRVSMGQLGFAMNMETGQPLLLSRGEHIINSLHFVWMKFVNFSDQITKLNQLQVIRIETGKIGYAFRSGNLVILKPGLHLIEPPDRFGDIMSTQMQVLDLPLGIHETSDYVALAIRAAVFYRIIEPHKTLVRIKNVKQQISETAVATLAGIMRASSLSDLGSRTQAPSKSFYDQKRDDEKREMDGYAPRRRSSFHRAEETRPFFQHVHDEFMSQLHDHVLDEWGIEIQNIRIESLKINDPELQRSISNNAIEVSKQHNKYIMLQKKQEIMVVEAETAAAKLEIQTNAKTSSIRAKAQAEADAVIIAAEAEKDSVELRGEGESEFARLLQSSKLGNKLALMKVQQESLQGLRKVMYLPQEMRGALDPRSHFFALKTMAKDQLSPDEHPDL